MGYVTNVVNAMIAKGNIKGLSTTRAPNIGQVDRLLAKSLGTTRALTGVAAGCASAGEYAKACVKHYGLGVPPSQSDRTGYSKKAKKDRMVGQAINSKQAAEYRVKKMGKMGRASAVRSIDPSLIDCSAYLERVQTTNGKTCGGIL